MIYGLGMQELLVILAIVILLFGGKRLPELGQGLGKAIRGFRQAEDETMKELKKAAEEDPSTGSGQGDDAEEEKRKEEEEEVKEKGENQEKEKGEEETEEKKGDPSTPRQGSGQAGTT